MRDVPNQTTSKTKLPYPVRDHEDVLLRSVLEIPWNRKVVKFTGFKFYFSY